MTNDQSVDVRTREHDRYREFTVTANNATVLIFNGIDVNAEHVFRSRRATMSDEWMNRTKAGKANRHSFPSEWGEEVVWDNQSVVAVLIPRSKDSQVVSQQVELDVYRFDRAWTAQPGRLWDGMPEEDKEDDDEDD